MKDKVTVPDLARMKADGRKITMLTAYDYSTASVFDEAGIPVLLVGDSAANVVYGYDTTVPVSIDELIPLVEEDSQPALWVLMTIYRRLLDKIALREYDVFSEKVSLTVREKLGILVKGFLKRLS